jgi:phenylacetate-CoA ligase
VPDGGIGELVLTTLCREAMPLLRYRTRDLTRVLGRSCPCGRNHVRLDRMRGRSDDMIVLRGVNIFPIQVEKILMQFPELGNNYLITLVTEDNNDQMIIEVELAEPTDDYSVIENLSKEIRRRVGDEILLKPRIRIVPKGTLPVSEGKAVRVVDKRKVYQ